MIYINRIYIILIFIIFVSFIYLYQSVSTINDKMILNVEKILVSKASYFAKNIDQELKNNIHGHIYEVLKENPELRERLEHAFSVVITPSFKYIYLLYRDKHGNYRYLLDGSKEDKGDFNQKLNVDKEEWNQVYKTKQPQILLQRDIDELYITYLTPIIFNNEVEAVLAIDFSTKLLAYISEIISPIENIFVYILITIVLLLLILLYQVLLNIKTKKESVTDPLTMVYNRNYLRDFLKNSNVMQYQIIMLDIDYFKKINDNYGHKAGDYILREVALEVQNSVRNKDKIIRFGGEEFLILIHKKHVESDALSVANRIRKALEKSTFMYEGTIIKITVSIGVELYPERFKNYLEAIKHADEKLYIAKKEGRNKVIFEKELSSKSIELLSIHDVKAALDDNRVVCHYQPIFDLKSKKVAKFEALVRVILKDKTVVYPASFLNTVNNTNIYKDLTKRVLDIVFEAIKKYNVAFSINLNLSDILDNAVYNILLKEIKKNKEMTQWLTIELLEYEEINTSILSERLLEIKSYGIKIALDDFGSGYSNFSIFKTFPIDILKIDGSLIKDIDISVESSAITESILFFSKKLGIETVAEFVHKKEVLETVQTLGIEYVQGFYIGKPQEDIKPLISETLKIES